MQKFIEHLSLIKYALILLLFFVVQRSTANDDKSVLSGYIQDAESGERLIAASIYHLGASIGTTTNNYGFFSITVPKGKSIFSISYLGYQKKTVELEILNDTNIVINLEREQLEIDEIVIVEKRGLKGGGKANHLKLAMNDVLKLPVILGETDVLKAYQLMPGIQSGIEGTAGMIIRGSDAGQNLILLDGVPVYNVNHLFGLFSVFNTDAIKSSTLMIGAFPARYGGRTASIMDIRMKEGNNQTIKGAASVGLISIKALVEGPIKKDRTSFLLSARRSYIDLFAYPYFKWIMNDEALWTYKFYDLNIKLNHILNDRNRVYFSYYNGQDKYKFENEEKTISNTSNEQTYFTEKHGFSWGNNTGTIRWNHQFGNRLFSNTTFVFSQYRFQTNNSIEEMVIGDEMEYTIFETDFYSGIADYGAAIDFDFRPTNKHHLRYGCSITHHRFRPGVNVLNFSDFEGLLEIDSMDTGELHTNIEMATYLENEFTLTDKIDVQVGIRYSVFQTNKMTYHSLEPRISISWMLFDSQVINLAYSKTSQPIHLLTNSSVGFPTDQWVPVTEKVKPIIGNQLNLSYQFNIGTNYNTTVSTFYKTMENVLEYKDNADRKMNWQDIIEQGEGSAKGIEILFGKKVGQTTGWLAYTISKSDRTFKNINEGRTFPYKYDRRHDIKVVIMHRVNKKVDFSANWIYNSGHAVTLPLEVYVKENITNYFNGYFYPTEILNYDDKNGFRMPNYHRLDVAINFRKVNNRFDRTLTLGIYNVYMHRNAFYYDFYDGKLRSHSVIPIMPSINYSIRF